MEKYKIIVFCVLIIFSTFLNHNTYSSDDILTKKSIIASQNEPSSYLGDDAQFTMFIDDISLSSGDEYLLPINGTWAEEFRRMRLRVEYDESQIEIIDFTLDDTVGENVFTLAISNPGEEYFSIVFNPAFDFKVESGSGILLYVNIKIKGDANLGTTFLNLIDGPINPTAYYPNSSDWQNPMIPEKTNGTVTIRNFTPPETPDKPTGESSGYVTEYYTFSTDPVVDSDGDSIQYGWDMNGDLNIDQWTTEPRITYSWQHAGQYIIQVKTKDSTGDESSFSDSVLINITEKPEIPELEIEVQNQIEENQDFIITVKSDEIPVEGVNVNFNENDKITDSNGEAIFTAPEVTSTKILEISATLSGYQQDTSNIVILNIKEEHGWVFGIISDNNDLIVSDVEICAQLEGDESTSQCTLSDNLGRYVLSLPTGKYNLKTNKDGFISSIKSVTINDNVAFENNIIISVDENDSIQTSNSNEFVDYFIQSEKANVKVDITGENVYDVSYYTEDELSVSLLQKRNEFTVTVNGTEDTSGKLILIRIDDFLSYLDSDKINIDDISLNYDGSNILKNNLNGVVSKNTAETPTWTSMIIDDDMIVLIWVPSFSEHKIVITIEDIVSLIGGPEAVIYYCFIAVASSLFFIVPLARNYDRMKKNFVRKKK